MGLSTWLNQYRVRSTSIVAVAMWMLIDCQFWAKQFASTSPLDGLGIAAVIAAVTGPATLLAGWAFKIMQETKSI